MGKVLSTSEHHDGSWRDSLQSIMETLQAIKRLLERIGQDTQPENVEVPSETRTGEGSPPAKDNTKIVIGKGVELLDEDDVETNEGHDETGASGPQDSEAEDEAKEKPSEDGRKERQECTVSVTENKSGGKASAQVSSAKDERKNEDGLVFSTMKGACRAAQSTQVWVCGVVHLYCSQEESDETRSNCSLLPVLAVLQVVLSISQLVTLLLNRSADGNFIILLYIDHETLALCFLFNFVIAQVVAVIVPFCLDVSRSCLYRYTTMHLPLSFVENLMQIGGMERYSLSLEFSVVLGATIDVLYILEFRERSIVVTIITYCGLSIVCLRLIYLGIKCFLVEPNSRQRAASFERCCLWMGELIVCLPICIVIMWVCMILVCILVVEGTLRWCFPTVYSKLC